jgi:hypothetical protein
MLKLRSGYETLCDKYVLWEEVLTFKLKTIMFYFFSKWKQNKINKLFSLFFIIIYFIINLNILKIFLCWNFWTKTKRLFNKD